MPPTPDRPGSALSAAELNEQIRALLAQADGVLTTEQKQEYDDLVAEWAAAIRDEVTEAA
jgi:hypothetical protein